MAGQWVQRSLAQIVLAGIMVIAAPTQTRARRAVGLAVLSKPIGEHYSAGKFDEAIHLAEKSLDLTHTQTGADHLDTTAKMGWLAELCRNQGRYPRGRAVLQACADD
jgi:hypothetical protein